MQFRELPGVVIGWGDDSSFVFVEYDGAVTAVNVRTMTPTPVPLPVGASPGIVTISPA